MTREFIILPKFEKQWKHLGLSDKDLPRLQTELLVDPQVGEVMQGTGGVRKMRFSIENRGKSGSVRIIYVTLQYMKNCTLSPHIQKMKKTTCQRLNEILSNK